LCGELKEREDPKKLAPFLHLIVWKTKGKRGSIIHVGFQAYYLFDDGNFPCSTIRRK
jgi:hypothetical protein